MNLIWHYTVGMHRDSIMKDRMLLTEDYTTPQVIQKGTRGGVWFSSNQVWEPTAAKCLRRSRSERVAVQK